MLMYESKWIPEKECWRLVHPETGDFVAEYYPEANTLQVTKHRKTATINLNNYATDGVELIKVSKVYD